MVLSHRRGCRRVPRRRVDERMLFDIFSHFLGWMLAWMNLDHAMELGLTRMGWEQRQGMVRRLYGFARIISR